MTHQPALFDLPPATDTVTVQVYQHNGLWTATLNGGWWTGTGATAQEAAQRCVENYERELQWK